MPAAQPITEMLLHWFLVLFCFGGALALGIFSALSNGLNFLEHWSRKQFPYRPPSPVQTLHHPHPCPERGVCHNW